MNIRCSPVPAIVTSIALAAGTSGCNYGTPAGITPQQQQARVAFVADHADFSDRELAQLCPALYPVHFLTNGDKYPDGKADKGRKAPTVTGKGRADAAAAGCDVRP